MKVLPLLSAAMYGVTGVVFRSSETDKPHDQEPGECSSNIKVTPWATVKLPGGIDGRAMQNISKYYNPSGRALYTQVPPPPGLPDEVYKPATAKPKSISLSTQDIAYSVLEHKRRVQKDNEEMKQRVLAFKMREREKALAKQAPFRNDDNKTMINETIMANVRGKSVEQHQIAPENLPSWLWHYGTNDGEFEGIAFGWLNMSHMDFLKSEDPYQLEAIFDWSDDTMGGGKSIVVDLGTTHKVNVVRIDWAVCACRIEGSVRLQISLDGISFTTIATPYVAAWGEHNVKYYEMDELVKYFRILPTAISPIVWVGVWDLQIWSEELLRYPNSYGWYHSYQSGERMYGGTEINFLVPFRGVLYGTVGFWMSTRSWRPAEVVRLDCPFCDWSIEYTTDFAGRIECLKVMTWTPGGTNILTKNLNKLYISYYLNWLGEGRTMLAVQGGWSLSSWFGFDSKAWRSTVYFRRFPYNVEWFSSRCMAMFRDPILNVDFLFVSTGVWGIQRGTFCSTCYTWVYFADTTKAESDWLPTRPLALTVLDERIYTSTLSWIKKRVNGLFPYWYIVFEMAHVDDSTVETAPGGIRGLTTIPNPSTPGGLSLYYLWVANAGSEGCMYRLDPCSGATCANTTISPDFNYEKEGCVRKLYSDYLGKTRDNMPAHVSYIAANYNYPTPFTKPNGDTAHLIGFEALIYGYSTGHFPIDPNQHDISDTGYRMGYHAAGGYLIRHSKENYEVREPWGRHYDPLKYRPTTTAIRTIAVSPFGDGAFYMGGYDPNHFPVTDTAWVMRGEASAVWEEEVPCLPEEGCPHTPGDKWTMKGCRFCRSWRLIPDATAFWFGFEGFGSGGPNVMRCQGVMKYLNSAEGADYCEEAKDWSIAAKCCEHVGCDICKDLPDKVFNPYALASAGENGTNYNCRQAMQFRVDSYMDCRTATETWQSWCCKKDLSERGDGSSTNRY